MASSPRHGENGRRVFVLGFLRRSNGPANYRRRRRKNSPSTREILISGRDLMSPSEREFHRKAAVECFNKTWKYLEKRHRTSGDDRLMLNLAHSSRYHWNLVGKASNFAIGDWQISRVYSTLNQPDLAIHFARTS